MRVLMIFILLISLMGCKETHCPAFPQCLVEYFPYTNSDVLRFKNIDDEILILNVNKDWTSDSYSFAWNCKCSCGAGAGFETDLSPSYDLRVTGNIDADENSFELICYFDVSKTRNDVFSYYKEGLNPFNQEVESSLPDTIDLNLQKFSRVNNVKIIKKKGIVEFWDKKQNCVWRLIE